MVIVPILMNKDVFEPNNNLKFTVQNHNYFFINLINVFSTFMCLFIVKIPFKKILQNRVTEEPQILILKKSSNLFSLSSEKNANLPWCLN